MAGRFAEILQRANFKSRYDCTVSGIIIAIDGPAGAGKSTISKKLAAKMNASILDTGAIYRAITLALLVRKITPDAVRPSDLANLEIQQQFVGGTSRMFLNGEDISGAIRTEEIARNVSSYAAIESIRHFAVDLQQSFIQDCLVSGASVVIEGRDIATVVAPDADLKIFLTASAEVRAQRRSAEVQLSKEETLTSILERDRLDSTRHISPLRKSDEAIEVDATDKSIDEVVEAIYALAQKVSK